MVLGIQPAKESRFDSLQGSRFFPPKRSDRLRGLPSVICNAYRRLFFRW